MNYPRTSGACCNPCLDPAVVNVPGQQGPAGADGAAGADGLDAWTLVTVAAVMPAVGLTVTVDVGSSIWMGIGQIVFIEDVGSMQVVSKPTSLTVELENLGWIDNVAAPTDPIPLNAQVSPGGTQGASGTAAAASGSVAIPNATQSFTMPAQAFGFVPSVILATVRKPAGGANLQFNVVDGTETANTFTIYLSAPTPSTGYVLDYLVLP